MGCAAGKVRRTPPGPVFSNRRRTNRRSRVFGWAGSRHWRARRSTSWARRRPSAPRVSGPLLSAPLCFLLPQQEAERAAGGPLTRRGAPARCSALPCCCSRKQKVQRSCSRKHSGAVAAVPSAAVPSAAASGVPSASASAVLSAVLSAAVAPFCFVLQLLRGGLPVAWRRAAVLPSPPLQADGQQHCGCSGSSGSRCRVPIRRHSRGQRSRLLSA